MLAARKISRSSIMGGTVSLHYDTGKYGNRSLREEWRRQPEQETHDECNGPSGASPSFAEISASIVKSVIALWSRGRLRCWPRMRASSQGVAAKHDRPEGERS